MNRSDVGRPTNETGRSLSLIELLKSIDILSASHFMDNITTYVMKVGMKRELLLSP
jgi:hypothetical protein